MQKMRKSRKKLLHGREKKLNPNTPTPKQNSSLRSTSFSDQRGFGLDLCAFMANMRFKKGDRVEVFCQNQVPSGSWRCAQIIGGNGHHYIVKHDGSAGSCGGEGVYDRVPRKAMRPCPPVSELSGMWVTGDVVEVFHCSAWKMATIVKVLSIRQYLVRLIGSRSEFQLGEHDLRPVLCWQDDEWVTAVPKGSEDNESKHNRHSGLKHNTRSRLFSGRACRHLQDEFSPDFNYAQQSQAVLSRSLKRSFPFCHSETESYVRPCKKIRVDEKNSLRLRFVFAQQPPLPKKVGAVASSKQRVSENYLHSSFNYGITGCSDLILERKKTDGAIGCSHAIRLELSEDSVTSSVGSCDVLGNYSRDSISRGLFEDSDRHSSDAESCCRSGSEEENYFLPTEKMLKEEVHRLELNAYRRILKVFHASGPLSWDRESLLTELRHSLHISNDEHLMELKHFVSNSSSSPTR